MVTITTADARYNIVLKWYKDEYITGKTASQQGVCASHSAPRLGTRRESGKLYSVT